MKRTPIKRGRPPKRRSRLKRISAKKLRQIHERQAFRSAVLARAKGRCERCQDRMYSFDLDAHHRLPTSQGGKHELSNGACLCRRCHRLVHDHGSDEFSPWWEWIEVRNELGKTT